MAVAKTLWGFIEERDLRLMRRVHRWRAPRWIRVWMLAVTRLGDGWLWYALGLVILVFGGEQRFHAFAAAGAAALAGILIFRVLKNTSRRARPCHREPHCWATILPPDQFSFPSGHTISAFAIAVSLAHFYPQAEGYLLFLAASIAVSRIVLGMHFLSDVVVGAVIGIGLGCASLCLLG
jgi:undecaprenyl-diphosphatase